MPSEIKQCTPCKPSSASEFQDKTYGKNQRVFNQLKNGTQYRCTVCGSIKGSK